MKRFLSVILVLAFIFSLSAPLATAIVDSPDFLVYVEGVTSPTKFSGADTLEVSWLYQDTGQQVDIRNTQGIRLAYDKTVLQLVRWDASSAYDESSWSTSFVSCTGAASPTHGVYPYNFNVSAAQNSGGTTGYINMTLGHPELMYRSFLEVETLMKVRFAFRAGKSAADLRAGSIRCMTAGELISTGQTSAVNFTADGGTVYAYLNQYGSDLLNAPEITYPNSTVTGGPTLTLSSAIWSPASSGGSTSVTVTSDTSWTASSNAASWLTVTPASGSNNGTLTLTAQSNSGAGRTGRITVTGGGVTRYIDVTQAGVSSALTVSPTTWSTAAGGGNTSVTVTSNTTWTASSNATWLTVSPSSGTNNGTLTLTAAANTGTESRSGTITVTGGGITRTITVTQAGVTPSLTVSPTTWSPAAGGGNTSVTVTSNTSWTASSNAAWLTVSPSSGTNNGTLTLTAAANTGTESRSGTITVTGGGITRTINVTQAGAAVSLTVSPTTLSPAAGGGNTSVTVTSNTSWTASSNATWLTVSPSSGTNNGTLTLTAAANTGTESRSGTITVTGGGITRTINVIQAGASVSLTVSPTTWSPAASGDNTNIMVTSTISWTASSNATWLTVSPGSGTGSGGFTATAAANGGTESRSGTITVTGGGITRTITVTQAGAETTLTVWPAAWYQGSVSGSANISVTSNTTWTASSNVSWLTLSSGSGTGNGSFTATVTANAEAESRIGIITVIGGGIERTITVNQQAGVSPTLTVSPTTWSPAAGGGNTSVTVTSNTTWTASSNATWLTVSPGSGTGDGSFTATATANTGTDSRSGTITVTGGGITRTITVTQAGATVSTDPVASISAPSSYGKTNVLTYTISLEKEVVGINQFTITANFDHDMLEFAGGSEILIPGGSFLSETWDANTGEYKAWVFIMAMDTLFTAPDVEPILRVKFNIKGSGSDIVGTLTELKVTEVHSSTDARTIACQLSPDTAVTKYAPYDINGDGKIDMSDISLVIFNYYMVSAGDAKWDAAKIFDTDNNGRIELMDIMVISTYVNFDT